MYSKTNDISRGKDCKILHENAFERFHLASSSLKLMEKILMDRQNMECDVAEFVKKFCRKWNKILQKNIDLEYGSMRHAWRGVIKECQETAKTHAEVQTEIGRGGGPLDTLKACMAPNYCERIRVALRHFRDTKTLYNRLINHVHRSKRFNKMLLQPLPTAVLRYTYYDYLAYYKNCRRFDRLKAEMHRTRYRSPKCPKFQDLKMRLEKQEQEVVRTRLTYQKKVLKEKENRPVYIRSMREIKEEFDQLEKERLNSVKEAFKQLIVVSENLDTSHEQQFIIHYLRQGLETMDLHTEVLKIHEPYMETYQVPHFEEHNGQAVPDFDEIRKLRQVQEIPEECSLEEEQVEPVVQTHGELPSLQIRHRPPEFDGSVKSLWWTDTPHTKNTVTPIVGPPLPIPNTEENRPVIIAFRNTAISPLRGLVNESPANEFYPGATAVLSNVKVKAIRAYTGRNPSELSFGIGQTIKQKTPADKLGMAYGWLKKRGTGKKRYGYFPVDCVKLKAKKEAIPVRILRAVTRKV